MILHSYLNFYKWIMQYIWMELLNGIPETKNNQSEDFYVNGKINLSSDSDQYEEKRKSKNEMERQCDQRCGKHQTTWPINEQVNLTI